MFSGPLTVYNSVCPEMLSGPARVGRLEVSLLDVTVERGDGVVRGCISHAMHSRGLSGSIASGEVITATLSCSNREPDLAALLPNLAAVRRPSKSAIVNSSIALTHTQRRYRAQGGRELRILKSETDALCRELNEWRDPSRSRRPLRRRSGAYEMASIPLGDDDDEDYGPPYEPPHIGHHNTQTVACAAPHTPYAVPAERAGAYRVPCRASAATAAAPATPAAGLSQGYAAGVRDRVRHVSGHPLNQQDGLGMRRHWSEPGRLRVDFAPPLLPSLSQQQPIYFHPTSPDDLRTRRGRGRDR
ncbi:hypothetical protein BKA62DRAFT_674301 [Auriculariales sp. MPI-PUGE-AT-0066]|nr:hypothetical protein BKA62DRAFT_674301 [Auriculariales sp. MPI-PUGE-AT-0066]